MNAAPDENPYGATCMDESQTVIAPLRGDLWSIVIVNCVFLSLNSALMVIGKLLLTNMLSASILKEFGLKLPWIAFFSYTIVEYWLIVILLMLCFSAATIVARRKLISIRKASGSYFTLFVIAIWTLYTLVFGFGILQPFYSTISNLTG